jgi:hypothetical protein
MDKLKIIEVLNKYRLQESSGGGLTIETASKIADEINELPNTKIRKKTELITNIETNKDVLRKKFRKFKEEIDFICAQMPESDKEKIYGSKERPKCFVSYWCEPNRSYTKMRFEMETTWNLKLRILFWLSNSNKFDKDFKKEEIPQQKPKYLE